MALNPKRSTTARNAAVNAMAALANNGYIRIYDGTQPADANTAVTTQNKLAELRFAATAFGAASGGVATANAIAASTVLLSGTATWFRVLQSDGTTVVWDDSVGTASAGMILNSVALSAGASIAITSLTLTENA